MIFFLAVAFGVGLGSSRTAPPLSATAGPEVYYSSGASNVLAFVTNSDSFYQMVEFVGAAWGTGVDLASSSPIVQLDCFTPETAQSSGTSLGFLSAGAVRARAVYSDGTAATYSAQFMTNTIASATNNVWQSFRPGWLGYALATNFVARTNGKTATIWSGITAGKTNLSGVTFNADGVITGCRGATAISPASDDGQQITWTLLTTRHAYARGHGMGVEGGPADNPGLIGRSVWFLGTNSSANQSFIQAARTVYDPAGEDWSVCIFSNDVPATVEPMRIATNSGLSNIGTKMTNIYGVPFQLLGTCQHNTLCSDTVWGASIFAGHNARQGGDSGAPNFLLLDNELVFVSGRTTTGFSQTMLTNINLLTTSAGLSTNNYQPQIYDLTGFPDL